MEHNMPVISKKMWGIVRVVFFMLRKGISKSKLMVDLNMMLKRGKTASKTAITNLMMFSHGRHVSSPAFVGPREYEFSCSNTPAYNILAHLSKRRNHHNFFGCAHAPQTQEEDLVTSNAVKAVLEMLNGNDQMAVEASPALPGFGRSPFVRKLRITDSPFPLKEVDEVDSGYVDKAAEEFIQKFYKELRNQSI
ncbi:hypothetical protein HS088_TW10G00661 [Tripterygium wilfordii]|uniref:Avr9/Cf-9 rapidly elicited protein 146 n=1 Tax=Tripterygium wilfordii TaxID=458696 RepID=A0A7J7D5M3_TRIWF|nr:uncharacterized protein LOC120007769 [Tripterygium wilfordii]KAF5741657.1 hypothetical protein HS088_TW10G00661 [Tripterygium wilfordii]